MMTSVYFTPTFNRKFNRFKKKYKSLEIDITAFIEKLPYFNASDLGGGVYKYRLSVQSKNKGKSGGFRIFAFEIVIAEDQKNIILLTLYDKSDQSSISKKEIKLLLKELEII